MKITRYTHVLSLFLFCRVFNKNITLDAALKIIMRDLKIYCQRLLDNNSRFGMISRFMIMRTRAMEPNDIAIYTMCRSNFVQIIETTVLDSGRREYQLVCRNYNLCSHAVTLTAGVIQSLHVTGTLCKSHLVSFHS